MAKRQLIEQNYCTLAQVSSTFLLYGARLQVFSSAIESARRRDIISLLDFDLPYFHTWEGPDQSTLSGSLRRLLGHINILRLHGSVGVLDVLLRGSLKIFRGLCNLFFRLHNSFQVPRTHDWLCDKWIVPEWLVSLSWSRKPSPASPKDICSVPSRCWDGWNRGRSCGKRKTTIAISSSITSYRLYSPVLLHLNSKSCTTILHKARCNPANPRLALLPPRIALAASK